MSRWLQRFTVFVLIAGLIAGGLGWASVAALRMEEKQRRAAAEKERADKMRRALWFLDAKMTTPLARENSRAFAHFTPLHSPVPALTGQGVACAPDSFRVPSPLMWSELPSWMLLHFQCTPGEHKDGGWLSPQVIKPYLRDKLQKEPFSLSLPNVTPQREELLMKFRGECTGEWLLAEIHRVEARRTDAPPETRERAVDDKSAQNAMNLNTAGNNWQNEGQRMPYNPSNGMPQQAPQPYADAEKRARQEVTNQAKVPQRTTRSANPDPTADAVSAPKIGDVVLAPMTALWFPSVDKPDYLIYARRATFGSKEFVQGVVINWPELRDELEKTAGDLFPGGRIAPLPDDADDEADNVMSALPAQLTGPSPEPSPVGWSLLRVGLGVAWSAVLLALLAMGLSAWSLIDLSERRIRFVSAVTHELRTPLTTLRLYLDMLTSGLVRDAAKKDEYLHTLNSESERLHRLISNVLDFARLEKQSARPAPADVALPDLMEQLKATWQSRCEAVGKDLVVENGIPAKTLHTDGVLVQQILGNLIDNACKYSQTASDRRVWLRADAAGDGIAFEVEDCGPGVSRREWRSIFRPFRRGHGADTTAGGVGLGLALAKRWSAMLGGRLAVTRGQRAGGACFRLELPA